MRATRKDESLDYALVELKEGLGAMVAQQRKEAGVTQSQLADKTGIQQAMVSKLENGKVNPTIETLECIACALGKKVKITFE